MRISRIDESEESSMSGLQTEHSLPVSYLPLLSSVLTCLIGQEEVVVQSHLVKTKQQLVQKTIN
jgi:hypothetical protein